MDPTCCRMSCSSILNSSSTDLHGKLKGVQQGDSDVLQVRGHQSLKRLHDNILFSPVMVDFLEPGMNMEYLKEGGPRTDLCEDGGVRRIITPGENLLFIDPQCRWGGQWRGWR